MAQRRRHRLLRAGAVHGRRRGDGVAAALPGDRRGHRPLRHRPTRRHRLHLLRQRRLPGRRVVRVRRQPRGHRRLAPHLGVATWRWTVRGRSTRPGCGSSTATSTSALVFSSGISSRGDLREVLCLQNDPYYLMPLWADHVSLAALQARRLARRRHGADGGRPRRGGGAQPPQRPRQPVRTGAAATSRAEDMLAEPLGRGAAPRRRLPAGLRRRRGRWSSWPATGLARCASARRGSGGSTIASSRTTRACATSPRASRRGSPASTSGVGDAPDRGGRARRPPSATRS